MPLLIRPASPGSGPVPENLMLGSGSNARRTAATQSGGKPRCRSGALPPPISKCTSLDVVEGQAERGTSEPASKQKI